MYRCHCEAPATRVVHVFTGPGHLARWRNGRHVKDRNHGTWAVCDSHLLEGITGVVRYIDRVPGHEVYVIRKVVEV